MSETVFLKGYANKQPIILRGASSSQAVVLKGQAIIAGPRGPQGNPGSGGGGPGGSGNWGDIAGDITDQADLQTEFATKLTKSSNLSDIPNPVQARSNLGLAIGADVEGFLPPSSPSNYIRGDKTPADLNTAIRLNRLDQMAKPTAQVDQNNQKIVNLGAPTFAQDAATKAYVDALVQGLNPKGAVAAATVAALPTNTYASGVITASGNGALSIDGVTLVIDDRVLIKNEVIDSKNGIYTVTAPGDGSNPFVLTRASDMDSATEIKGAFTFVTSGTVNGSRGFVVNSAATTYVIGTTPITFTQFSSATVPDASAVDKGKIQLAGDLGGFAAAPVVRGVRTIFVAPYGSTAVADYVVQDALNAHIEINLALLEAEAAGDAIVELLGGTFVLGAPVIPRSHTWLRGQGMWGQTRLTTKPNATFAPLDNYSTYPDTNPWSYGMVSDMELDGSNQIRSVAKKCFNSAASYKCQTFRIWAHDSTATGLGMDDYTAGWIYSCLVENCGFRNPRDITEASWASNAFTFKTDVPHGFAAPAKATALLTASAVNDGDTVTIDNRTYTFKTTLTGAAFEVLIGASVATALDNLLSAVNLTGVIGTDYGTGTTVHPTISATTNTDTTQLFVSKTSGDTYNTMVSTETGAGLSFGGSTFAGGATGSIIVITGMVPVYYNGRMIVSGILDAYTFTVSAVENSGSLNLGTDPGVATTFGIISDSLIGHNGVGIASGSNETESTIVSDCISINNQNNNFLIEADNNSTGANASYIFSNCISINAGNVGFLNTGTPNSQFNDCYDYGSPVGAQAAATSQTRDIIAASWSGGVITFQTALPHNYAADGGPDDVVKKVQIANMFPAAYNGYYTVDSTPTADTFTVALASNPGLAAQFGQASYVFHDVYDSSFNDCVFTHNLNWGIRIPLLSSGVMVKDTVVKYSYNYGIQTGSSNSQLSGLRVHNNGRQGIYIVTANNNVVPLEHIDISDTMLFNNNRRGIGTGIGLEINPGTGQPIQDVTLNNVQAWDNQKVKTQNYGILVRSGGSLSNISIMGGDLAGNGIQGLLDQDNTGNVKAFNVGGVNPVGTVALGDVSGAFTIDSKLGNFFTCRATGNLIPAITAALLHGTIITIQVTQDATGSRTWTSPGTVAPSKALTLTTTAAAVDNFTLVYDKTATKWRDISRVFARPHSITEGGTGAIDAATARTNLGIYSTAQVDSLVAGAAAGVGKRARLRVATTANITIATDLNNGDTLDGVTLVTGDLVLVKNQSTASQNGVYVVDTTPVRASEFDSYNEYPGSLVTIAEGTTNADTLWLCTSNDGGTLGSTALAFSKIDLSASASVDLDSIRRRPLLYSDFLTTTTTGMDPFLGVAIASGTLNAAGINPTKHHPGIVRIRSSTTTNSGALVGATSAQVLIGGDEIFECIFNIDTLTNGTFRFGLHDATTSADAVDGVYLEIDSTGVATGKTSSNSVRSSTASTGSISIATWYRLRITVNSAGTLVTYALYNDAGTLLWSDTLATNIPTTAGRSVGAGVIATNVGTVATDLLELDYMMFTYASDRVR